jgi:hypothetical protein
MTPDETRSRRFLHICLWAGALLAAAWAILRIWSDVLSLVGASSSGGLGAISAGFSGIELFILLLALGANRSLRRAAAHAGPVASRIRGAHLYVTLGQLAALLLCAALLLIGTYYQSELPLTAGIVGLFGVLGTLYPLQAFFLFAAICVTVHRRSANGR